ncbi:MAG TPA: hypothetical protein VMW73_10535 [Spirochaetia bacterium]|nr:hypothetical protein [Spirochaetia bacterium]
MRRASTSATVGSAAANLFAALFFLIVVAGSTAMLVRRLNDGAHAAELLERVRLLLDTELSAVIDRFGEDPTPASDAISDPIQEWCSSRSIRISDISSRIAPNWVAADLLRLPEITRSVGASDGVGGDLPLVLRQQREQSGFFSDIATGYGVIFPKAAYERYLTGFAYANVNLTDDAALRKLYEVRTSDYASAQLFQAKIRALRSDGRVVAEETLPEFLGADYDRLYPVVNALPWWNVNFLPLPILIAIISTPEFGVVNPQTVCNAIDTQRRTCEIGQEDLRSLVGLPAESLLYQYLGTTTWFWQIEIHSGSDSLSVVLCRLPPEWTPQSAQDSGTVGQVAGERRWFRVISRRYSR